MKLRGIFNETANLENALRGKYHQLFNQLAGINPNSNEYKRITIQLHTVSAKLHAICRL